MLEEKEQQQIEHIENEATEMQGSSREASVSSGKIASLREFEIHSLKKFIT